ncbi:MAG: hypothetical protein KJ548_04000 [Actinobacteria bacterium]|nr:hypothetical protein [Actinomycetota bacterium]MBU4335716.1 hypothetical protein [Actinomycetota bacterium]MCG2802826.1 hypothetical protein [Cellulomonas sp.]
MMIDCDTCTARGPACADCVVSFLTVPVGPAAGGPGRIDLGSAEFQALDVLAGAGMVPPLRHPRAG